jgi:hypothetical protein
VKFFTLFDFSVKDCHSVKNCHSREGGNPEKILFTPFLLEQMPFLFNFSFEKDLMPLAALLGDPHAGINQWNKKSDPSSASG